MDRDLTPLLNEYNIENTKRMIERKKNHKPIYATVEDTKNVITDMDHFPYTRFFRGVSYFPNPIVMEREAGWRPVQNSCYHMNRVLKPREYPNHCFETACSTVLPCFPKYERKYEDKVALDIQLNNTCVNEYR